VKLECNTPLIRKCRFHLTAVTYYFNLKICFPTNKLHNSNINLKNKVSTKKKNNNKKIKN
jgi:hypothetical protein